MLYASNLLDSQGVEHNTGLGPALVDHRGSAFGATTEAAVIEMDAKRHPRGFLWRTYLQPTGKLAPFAHPVSL